MPGGVDRGHPRQPEVPHQVGSRNGATKAPEAPSTWIGMSGPPSRPGGRRGRPRSRRPARSCRRRSSRGWPPRRSCSRRSASTASRRRGATGRPPSAPSAARPPSSGRTSPSRPGRWRPSPGWAGRRAARRSRRRLRQRHLSARPPSMHASLEPVVEQPMACSGSGACHRWARMLTQRRSNSAVCGYSSLSIMFLSSALGHQPHGLGLHPGGHERGQVEPGVAVQHELVVHQLRRCPAACRSRRACASGWRAGPRGRRPG